MTSEMKLSRLWLSMCFVFIVAVHSESMPMPDDQVRFCYECSGFQCLQNPRDPSLFPGRVRCHPVMDFCTTHIRYTPSNSSLAANTSLSPRDYSVTSATRACAKTWLGNTCRRDWLGKPEITCITTCAKHLCNCDSRSPPPEMFGDGRVLALAPDHSTYSERDVMSCRHMDGVPGDTNSRQYGSRRIDDDYSYYNDYEVMKAGRRHRVDAVGWRRADRRRTAAANCTTPTTSLISALFVIAYCYCLYSL